MATKLDNKKKRKQKSKPRRLQVQQKFWLNVLDPEEKDLADYCQRLRGERKFTATVRDGLLLMEALRRGETDLLFSMFPAIYQKLYAQMEADILDSRENKTISYLERMEGMLSNLSLPLALPAGSSMFEEGFQEQGGIRQLNVRHYDLPLEEDEEEELELVAVEAVVDGLDIARNFMNSVGTLNPLS
jgi:hypothetical protein